MDLAHLIVLIQAIATWFIFGLIAFVQLVHYPLLKHVGADHFVEYERRHVNRTTLVVGCPMLIELLTAVAGLFIRAPEIDPWIAYLGVFLLGVIWASSFTIQVPQHNKLKDGFAVRPWEILVKSNWIRTVAWGIRSVLLAWSLYLIFGNG